MKTEQVVEMDYVDHPLDVSKRVENKEIYPLEKDMGKEVDKLPIERITRKDRR